MAKAAKADKNQNNSKLAVWLDRSRNDVIPFETVHDVDGRHPIAPTFISPARIV